MANKLGWLSVDEMLEQMTPQEFDERFTADSLDPIDDSWLQTATIASALWNKLEEMQAILTRRDPKWQNAEAFLPKLQATETPNQAAAATEETEAYFKRLGGK